MAIYPIQQVHSYIKKLSNLKLASPIGAINNLVVFIKFRDDKEFDSPISKYENIFNKPDKNYNSLYNYFKEASYNNLSINSTFYPLPENSNIVSYRDSHPRCYYQPKDCKTNPEGYEPGEDGQREDELLINAINAIKAQVPTTLNIDSNNDGKVDNICFIIKGNADNWSDLLWPHMSSLYDQDVSINGKRVDAYNLHLENMSTTGVLCHEMCHSIGFPDLYHYNNSLVPVGTWDIMGSNITPPPHSCAYIKRKYGKWITNDIPEISGRGPYTLNPLTSNTNNAYKIASPVSSDEYFILEYRKQNTTFEKSLPGEGLIIYRINPDIKGNSGGNSDGTSDEVFVCRQGVSSTLPYGGNINEANLNKLENRTTLGGKYNPILLSDGTDSGLIISNVSEGLDTISFEIGTTADLSIETKLLSNSPFYVGQPLKYMLTIKNNGPDDAKNISVYNKLSNVDYTKTIIDNSGIGIWYSNIDNISGIIDSLSPDKSFDVIITVIPMSSNFVNNSNITSDTYDNNHDNNHSSIYQYLLEESDLSITSSISQNIVYKNDIIEYELTIVNNGPSPSTDVEILDYLPIEVQYISLQTEWSGDYNNSFNNISKVLNIFISKINVNEEIKFKIKVKVLSSGILINKATIKSNTVFDPNLNNNETILNLTVVSKLSTGPIVRKCNSENLLVLIHNTTNEKVELSLYNTNLNSRDVIEYTVSLNEYSVSKSTICHVSCIYEITIDKVPKDVYVSIFTIPYKNGSNSSYTRFFKHTELIDTN